MWVPGRSKDGWVYSIPQAFLIQCRGPRPGVEGSMAGYLLKILVMALNRLARPCFLGPAFTNLSSPSSFKSWRWVSG